LISTNPFCSPSLQPFRVLDGAYAIPEPASDASANAAPISAPDAQSPAYASPHFRPNAASEPCTLLFPYPATVATTHDTPNSDANSLSVAAADLCTDNGTHTKAYRSPYSIAQPTTFAAPNSDANSLSVAAADLRTDNGTHAKAYRSPYPIAQPTTFAAPNSGTLGCF